MIYFDANSTTAPSEAVIRAVVEAMAVPANPNSVHVAGAAARVAMERARDDVCKLLPGYLPEGIVFTSGGTEGSNAVLRGFGTGTVITTNVEHPSVSGPAALVGKLKVVPVDGEGYVSPDLIAKAVHGTDRPIVSIQHANGETGVIQPISRIVAAARAVRPDVFIHVDAAQSIGRIVEGIPEGVDAVTFSGHKLQGPAGTGVLALLNPGDERLDPFILGGGQESGMRSGTQNVAGAVGLGVACRERAANLNFCVSHMRRLRDVLERAILDRHPSARVNGAGAPRLPNTTNLMFPGVDGAALVAGLDARGVACSTGSACSSGRPTPSHVLLAMGLSEREAYSCVRFSLSPTNSLSEVVAAALKIGIVLRELSR